MEKAILPNKYELVIIVDSKLTSVDKDSVVKEATDIIQKSGGKVINSQMWLEKQKIAFPINKTREGSYYVVNFESEGPTVEKMRPLIKINEKIIRSAIVRV